MNGLGRPDAGGLAGIVGGVEVAVAAGGFAGICTDGLAGTDAGGGGAGEGVAAGGFAGLAAGAAEVVAAGGVAAVCASAPDMRRGNAASAPANKTRSVMRQDPTGETRFMRAPN